jgi:Ca2+-binding RTX toxin-like protein
MESIHRISGLRRTAALVVATAAAALAIPAAANAAVTGDATGNTAVLTGDAAPDTITIGINNGLLTHNLGTATGFEDETDFDSTEDGSQTLTAAAGTLTINGGGGDDIITGGPNNDVINGGDGSDRLTGFRGADTKNGGLGNDVIIWNNGDGNDTDNGGDGADEQVINGRNTTDDMTVVNQGGVVRFDRVDPGKFNVTMDEIERLSINSLQGDDKLVTAPDVTLPITVDAGAGKDSITTGGAADLVQGGEGDDFLNGAGGGDRVLGNPGADKMNGGDGDDTLVWNNGDGNDEMNGHAGLDRIEDNLGAANDISSLDVRNGKVHYARQNNPFELDVAESEVFELNTFGGNDTLDVKPGIGSLIAVVADAGSGNDRFTGGDETDTFFGGLGNDTLDPGAGAGDLVDGQGDNDTLKVRDNQPDLARGGSGTDSAVADQLDLLVDVESKDVPVVTPPAPAPEADTQGTAARVLQRRVTSKLKKGVYTAKIRVECPASEAGGCAGALVLQTAKTVSLGGTKFRAVVAAKRYKLDRGERVTLKVKLPKGVRALSKRGTLSLKATTTNTDAAGNLAQRTSKLAIKLVR